MSRPPVKQPSITCPRCGRTAGGLTPREAVYRLVEVLVDGGICTHCSRPTGVSDDFEGTMPAETLVCWYRYDPELKVFRRGCE